MEEWKPIPTYLGYELASYEVSNLGRLRTKQTGKIHKGSLNKSGYRQDDLLDDGHTRRRPLRHSLVAAAFLGPKPDSQVVRHLNNEPDDNDCKNLRYGTQTENYNDKHGSDFGEELCDSVHHLYYNVYNNMRDVAKKLSISLSTVQRIITGDPR